MPIRITGMNSGFDTENIISELVKAQQTKVDSVKKKQTTLQWKQDAWKDLNSRIYKLFNTTINNMRFEADYSKKVTDVSNSAIASIITGDSAMNTTQELEVKELATSGYMTGGEIEGNVTKSTKLTDLGIAENSIVTVATGGKTTDIKITSDMTVNAFVEKLKTAGVDANFDEKNKRLHIASKGSGKENDFAIIGANAGGIDALKKLHILNYDATAKAEYEKYKNMTEDEKDAAITADVNKQLQSYINQRTDLLKTEENQKKTLASSKTALEGTLDAGETIDAVLADADYKTNLQTKIDALKDKGDTATANEKEQLAKLQSKMSAYEKYESDAKALSDTQASLDGIRQYIDDSDPDNIVATGKLKNEIKKTWEDKIDNAKNINYADASDAIKNEVKDAEIMLNGVTYKGSSNTFEINGLTITALQKSSEKVTLSTRQDTDGIYNMIKNFITEYNSIINEMDKLYNAESIKGYEPLTDDEKKELSDSDVEKWEKKIKDSILRRDSNLSTISSAMKNIMLQGAEVNGKRMYLSDFGIATLGYFKSGDNEKNAYHIDGDEDDSSVSANDNLLRTAIAANPEDVISFFAQLSTNMYNELSNQSRSMEGIRTFGSFYDDKKMKEDYDNYTTKIKKQENKLKAMEERWYNKFSAMETALARMQSNQSAVASLLGG